MTYPSIELVGNLFIHVSEDVYVTWTFGHCLYQKCNLRAEEETLADDARLHCHIYLKNKHQIYRT